MTTPLKVAHVITKLAVGGAQESALVSVAGLNPAEFDQWLVSGTEVDEEGSLRADAEAAGVRVVDAPRLVRSISPANDFAAIKALRDHFRAAGPDVVHTHSSKAGLVGRAAARLAGIPVVHSVHGWSFHGEMSRTAVAGVVAAERLAARGTAALIYEGTPDRAKGLDRGIGKPEQYTLIRNGIDLAAFASPGPNVAATRGSLGVPADAWLIGTVGRLADQKDPLAMVDAVAPLMADHPDLWFVWVGDGPLRTAVEARAHDAGVADRFVLAGVRRDVPAVLAALDTFALSSLWEGLPRTVTEALASGLPVAATAVDGCAEVIIDGRNGLLVPPHNPGALGAALARIKTDGELRAKLATEGPRRAAEFDRHEMLRRLADLYRRVAAGQGPTNARSGWDDQERSTADVSA